MALRTSRCLPRVAHAVVLLGSRTDQPRCPSAVLTVSPAKPAPATSACRPAPVVLSSQYLSDMDGKRLALTSLCWVRPAARGCCGRRTRGRYGGCPRCLPAARSAMTLPGVSSCRVPSWSRGSRHRRGRRRRIRDRLEPGILAGSRDLISQRPSGPSKTTVSVATGERGRLRHSAARRPVPGRPAGTRTRHGARSGGAGVVCR